MAKPTYFWGVFNVDKHVYLASLDSQSKAVETAKEMAKQHVGETFVILECKEAFTSRVSVERAYFDWPASDPMPEKSPAHCLDHNLPPLSDAAGKAAAGFTNDDF